MTTTDEVPASIKTVSWMFSAGEGYGESASSRVEVTFGLTRELSRAERQALSALWHGHDAGCCKAQIAAGRSMHIPDIAYDEIQSHYEFLRDLLAHQVPDATARREDEGVKIQQSVRGQIDAIKADIAARGED